MKTKQMIINIQVAILFSVLTSCGEPVQKFMVEVVDESNTPLKGVEVAAWFNKRGKTSPLDSYKVTGSTDDQGKVEIEGETVWYQTSVSAQPAGFYKSMKYDHWTKKRTGNRWEPWPVEVKLVMKKIGNPHPMYVMHCGTARFFKFPKNVSGSVGFDLLQRDWVAPYGKGEQPDFLLKGVKTNDGGGASSIPPGYVHLTFPNPGDGILPSSEEIGGSLLFGPHKAPEGGYLNEWKFPNHRTPEGEKLNPVSSAYTMVFRVRTELDSEGKVKSAYYGKLPGGFFYSYGPYSESLSMTYYLNEQPNDRRLEWDMENNLFKDITSGEPHRP